MSKEIRIRVASDGAKGFFDRARAHARKLDKGEKLLPEITVSFESAADMMRVLSPERIRLLHDARRNSAPVSDLASGLKRDKRAVSRDVDLLERFGLLRSRYATNPGHGRRRIVESPAAKYRLTAII